MFSPRRLCSIALLGAATACAQQSAPPADRPAPETPTTTLSVDARLVNLPVVVRDKKGALVQSLTKQDFVLSVDGHRQTIRYFDRDNNLPLTLGLLVDTSLSQSSVLEQERTASAAFLDQMLTAPAGRAPDQAFVIQFAHEIDLLQDLTSSRPKLQAAIQQIDSSGASTVSQTRNDPQSGDADDNGQGRRGHGIHGGGGTTLYDAVFLSADELMSKQHGRKAVVVLSDGVDRGSKESLASAIEAAQRADTIVYAIYFKGEQPQNSAYDRGGRFPGGGRGGIGFPGGGGGYPGGGGGYPRGGGYPGGGGGQRGGGEPRVDGKKILERISGETGGRLFEVSKKQDVGAIYSQIAEELRSQYRLGYTPDAATASEGYHKVQLNTPKDLSLKIQTRDGYYTSK